MPTMNSSTFREWATTHPAPAVNRIVRRIERFAGNTADEETSLAAQDLVDKLKEAIPNAPKAEEPPEGD